ncbi:hypothetical protein DMA11_10080 [Marinilabiliaceae bacterium JC017]|nr:hypothetical protein DMA11_10080 [Marinilabiliaceae bacterium JC017]
MEMRGKSQLLFKAVLYIIGAFKCGVSREWVNNLLAGIEIVKPAFIHPVFDSIYRELLPPQQLPEYILNKPFHIFPILFCAGRTEMVVTPCCVADWFFP